jgi:hypothetical protein
MGEPQIHRAAKWLTLAFAPRQDCSIEE